MYEDFLDHEPLTEEEALGLLPNGIYQAIVDKSEIRTAKSGKRYFTLTFEVFDNHGNSHFITKMLVFPYLLKHLYESTDQAQKYQENKLYCKDHLNKKVGLKLIIQQAKDGFPAKNDIADIIKPSQSNTEIFRDDIIPF